MAKEKIVSNMGKKVSNQTAKNEAKRLEEKVRTYNNSVRNNSNNLKNSNLDSDNNLDSSSKKKSMTHQDSNNSDMKDKLKKKVGSAALQAYGVPKEYADKAMDFAQTEKGKKVIKKMNKMQMGPLGGDIANRLMYGKEEKEEESGTGLSNFKIPKVVIKWALYISIPAFVVLIFINLFVSASQVYLSVIGIGQADQTTSSDADKKIEDNGDKDLDNEIQDETAYSFNVTISRKQYANYYILDDFNILIDDNVRENTEADLSELKDFYGSNLIYNESSNMKTVYNFYYKLHDIYFRYLKKPGVALDIPLLMSTLKVQSSDMNEIFVSNTTEMYDRTNIKEAETSILDYDQDWSSYNISYDNSAHDIEILAQNMISQGEDGKYFVDYKKYNEFLKEFLEKKYYINGKHENTTSSTCSSDTTFIKYDLTDDQVRQLASQAYHEQGTAKGAAAEASLMANLFEIKGSKFGTGANGLYNYVRNSGWFANAAKNMDSYDASEEIVNAVRNVLVEGKRTLPGYIDEHDMFGDISSATNNGEAITIKNRDEYKKNVTKIKNIYGATYTFYSFPDTRSDPFGYTSEKIRQAKGEFYFDYDTGLPQNCNTNSESSSQSKNSLASAFVSLAVSQLNDPSKKGGEKYWRFLNFQSRTAWCAAFVSWNIYNTTYNGVNLKDIINKKSATVVGFMNYFYENKDANMQFKYNDSCSILKGKNGTNSTYIPKEGDLIFFDNYKKFNDSFPVKFKSGRFHIGIVQYVKDGIVMTIEGNSGDQVKERKYSLSDCQIAGYGSWY